MSAHQVARFVATLDCESDGFKDPAIQSQVPHKGGPNGQEDSWGYAQVHLPDHSDISREQAVDPTFAVLWAAKEFMRRPEQWSCYSQQP
jgi:hypothetical protein